MPWPTIDLRFNIYADPTIAVASRVAELATLLGLSDRELRSGGTPVGGSPTTARWGNRPWFSVINPAIARHFWRNLAAVLDGFWVRDEPHRRYVHGDLAAHVLGYMNHPTTAELAGAAGRGYRGN